MDPYALLKEKVPQRQERVSMSLKTLCLLLSQYVRPKPSKLIAYMHWLITLLMPNLT